MLGSDLAREMAAVAAAPVCLMDESVGCRCDARSAKPVRWVARFKFLLMGSSRTLPQCSSLFSLLPLPLTFILANKIVF